MLLPITTSACVIVRIMQRKLKMRLYQILWKLALFLLLVFFLLGSKFYLQESCNVLLFGQYSSPEQFPRSDNPLVAHLHTKSSYPTSGHSLVADLHRKSSQKISSSSCMSRLEYSSYHKTSSRFGIPAELSVALEKYEELHERCSFSKNWTDAFLNPDPSDSCKYLVYIDGPAGLGNRILSLASAFLFALLTNRVLLLDQRGHLQMLVCEPFERSSWVLPPNFPIEDMDNAPKLRDAFKEGLINLRKLHLYLREDQIGDDHQFFCLSTQKRLESVPWLAWNSNLYYATRFFTMPTFWPRLIHLFPDASFTFTHLSRYLFLPNNALWDKTTRIHLSYFSSSQKKVGLQIRLHSRPNLSEFYPPAYAQIMNCLINNNLLPNASSTTDHSMTNTFSYNKELITDQITSLLVTALQGKYYEEIKRLYMNNPTQDGRLVQIHTVTTEGVEWHSLDQAMKAFVEMWLLSFSDELATSSWSTFGYVAQGLGAISPYLLNVRGDFEKNQLPPCVLGQSVDPCNHRPFMSSCQADILTSDHSHWIQNHIKPCQDEVEGLQLVHPASTA